MQPGQRVMFQHGNLHEVVDQEKEPCGCPPDAEPKSNEFPLAQSEGLAAKAPPVTSAATAVEAAKTGGTLAYNGEEHAAKQAASQADASKTAAAASAAKAVTPVKKKGGFFGAVGRFFKKLFGAE